MKLKYKYLLAALTAVIAIINLSARTRVSDTERENRKSDYIFGESLYYYLSGDDATFFDMAAYAADSPKNDDFLNALKGLKMIMENHTDSLAVQSGKELAKIYISDNPDDSFLGLPYARMLASIGNADESVETVRKLHEAAPGDANIMLYYMQALASTGKQENIRQALELSERFENQFGRDINSFQRKTRLYSLLGDSLAVMNEGRRLLNESPESPLSLTMVGSIYDSYNRPDSAEYFYNKAIECDPSFPYPYLFRNHLYLNMEDTTAYVRSNMQAVREIELPEEAKISILQDFLTNTLQSPQFSSQAEEALEYLIESYPHNVVLRQLGARYYTSNSQIEKAADCAQFAVDLDPSNPEHRKLLTAIFQYAGDYVKAAEEARKAAAVFPDEIDFPLTAVSNYTLLKQYDKALSLLDTLIINMDTLDTERKVMILRGKGDVYNAMDSLDLACNMYAEALAIFPDDALTLNNYAYALACASKDLDTAYSMINRALRIRPKDINSLDTLAWILFRMKRYTDAKEAIDSVVEYDSESDPNEEVLEHAGDIYFMAGYPEDAVEFWEKALEKNPDNKLLQKKVKNKAYYYR